MKFDRQVDLEAALRIKAGQSDFQIGLLQHAVDHLGAAERGEDDAGLEEDCAVFDADADRTDRERNVERVFVVERHPSHQRRVFDKERAAGVETEIEADIECRLQLQRFGLRQLGEAGQVQPEIGERVEAQLNASRDAGDFQIRLELRQPVRGRRRNDVE